MYPDLFFVYCDECFAIRQETGETPAKPIRLLCTGAEDGVLPLTEMSSTPGSDGQLPRTFRNLGAQLQEAQGGARLLAESGNYGRPVKAAAGLPAVLPGEEPLAGGDDTETQVDGTQAILGLIRAEQRKWGGDEALRRAKAEAATFDKFEGLGVQLSNLMGMVGDVDARLTAKEKGKELSTTTVPAATASAAGSDGDAGDSGSGGEVRSFEAIKDARKLAEDVMGKVHGKAPPGDTTASPIKRLEAQMAGSSRRDEKVSRSPKEVRAKARSIAEGKGGARTRLTGALDPPSRDSPGHNRVASGGCVPTENGTWPKRLPIATFG